MKLFYRYKSHTGVKQLTAADQIVAVGDEWSYVYWNPETDEYREDIDELVQRETDRPTNLSDSLGAEEM